VPVVVAPCEAVVGPELLDVPAPPLAVLAAGAELLAGAAGADFGLLAQSAG